MSKRFYLIIIFAFIFPGVTFGKIKEIDFFAFCYHDVRSGLQGDLHADSGAVSTKHLVEHFEWIKDNGYTVVSLNDIIEAKKGRKSLPEKSIYLTFDDGYSSFYTHIYPLLKLYNYPATFAVVTSWIESEETVKYGRQLKKSSDFLTWDQIREMQQSGLIEIASHSHDLHKGVIANPQSNTQPAATARIFSAENYESEAEYKARINKDLLTSFELISQNTGVKPRAMVWPYGSYSELAWEIAKGVGFEQSLILEEGQNQLDDEHIQRFLVSDNPNAADIELAVEPYSYKQPHRAVHVDLDYVYDPNPDQQHKNLGVLLERIKAMNISHVYLQAFADEDGDGNASSLYFPNRHLPLKADLFNRVAWQLKTRAEVQVYAWMPVMAFDLGDEFYQQHGVKTWDGDKTRLSTNNYQRLSIFKPESRQVIHEIYEDLGRYSYVSGVLFHDDAFLTDSEDVSPEALEYYRQQGINFTSIEDLLAGHNRQKWTQVKTQALIDFTLDLSAILERYNGAIQTARNIYARPIIEPQAKQWFAQDLTAFTNNYDYTAIMAMPYMEQAKDSYKWLQQLMKEVGLRSDKDKVVMELQTTDWRSKQPVADEILLKQMELFMLNGFINYGYYPDDFINDHPTLKKVIKGMSLSSFPREITLYE